MNTITNKLFDFVSEYSYEELMSLQDWPTDEEGELLSTENISIEGVREDEVDLLVGGDWQDPKYITLHLDDDLELKVKCHSWQPADNEVYTYWFVSYAHSKGQGRAYLRLLHPIFNINRVESLIEDHNGYECSVTYFQEVSEQDYLEQSK